MDYHSSAGGHVLLPKLYWPIESCSVVNLYCWCEKQVLKDWSLGVSMGM